MSKFLNINFEKTNDSGMAKVSVYNDTKSEFVIENDVVDLWCPVVDEGEVFSYKTTIVYPDDTYSVEVVHAGYHNVDSVHPYSINVLNYSFFESIDDAMLDTNIVLRDSANNDAYTFSLAEDSRTTIELIKTYSSNGVLTDFLLDDVDKHAYEFVEWSLNGGTSWFYPDDTQVTWGSNVDIDDEVIDVDGHFGIKFLLAPSTGTNNIILKYKPKYNKAILSTKLVHATDGIQYRETTKDIKALDFALEFIKG